MLGHSCDSLRSVESLKSDSTTGGRKEEKEKKTKLHSSRHRNSSTSESKGEATKSVKIHSSRHQNSSTSASKNEATKSGKDRKRESKSRREKVTMVKESLLG